MGTAKLRNLEISFLELLVFFNTYVLMKQLEATNTMFLASGGDIAFD